MRATADVVATNQALRQQRQDRRAAQVAGEVAQTETGSMQVWIADQVQRDPAALRRTLRRIGYGRRDVEDVIARAVQQAEVDNYDPETVQRMAAADLLRQRAGDQIPTGQPLPNYDVAGRIQMVAEQARQPVVQEVAQQQPAPRQGQAFGVQSRQMAAPGASQPQVAPAQPQPGQLGGMPRPLFGPPGDLNYAGQQQYMRDVMAAQEAAAAGAFAQQAPPPSQANPFAQFQGRLFETGPSGGQENLVRLINSPQFSAYLGHPYVSRRDVQEAAREGMLTQDMVDQFAASQSALLAVNTGQPQQISPQAVVGFLDGAGVRASVSGDGSGVVLQEGYSGQPEEAAQANPPVEVDTGALPAEVASRASGLLERARTTDNVVFAARAGREMRAAMQAENRTPEGRRRQADGLLRVLADPDPSDIMVYGALVGDQELMELGNQLTIRQLALFEAASGGRSPEELEYIRAQTQNELAQTAERWNNVELDQVRTYGDLLATLSQMRAGAASVGSEALQRIISADLTTEATTRAVGELFNIEGAMRTMNDETQTQFLQVIGTQVPYRSQDVVTYDAQSRFRRDKRRLQFFDAQDAEQGGFNAQADALLQ